MYELFEDDNLPTYPTVKVGQIDLLRRTYQREVLKVIDYYGSRVSVINNDHILNRLITTACPPIGYDLTRFLSSAIIRSPIIADNFQLTSPSNYGKIFNGVFYGGAMEIIMTDDTDFDAEDVYNNWKDVDAVKVLHHPFTDLKLIPPFGQKYTNKEGLLVVLSVNIPKLLVQYKGFVDSRRFAPEVPLTEKLNLGSAHFIKMHVLPNILRSHVEFLFYNRLKDIFYVLPNYEALGTLPFPVVNYSKMANEIFAEYVDSYRDRGVAYPQLLQSIPGVFKDRMLDTLRMPDLPKTKQVWWALFMARLEDQFFLLHLHGDPGISNNRKYYSKFLVNCKWFLRDNTFKGVLSNSIYKGYLKDMGSLLDHQKR